MGLVVNNHVKMEWEESLWLQRKAKKGKEPMFMMAGKEYETEKTGKFVVCFMPECAFVYSDEEEGMFDFDDVRGALQEDPMDFPFMYDGYLPIAECGASKEECVNEPIVEELGLTPEQVDDIWARLNDLGDYGGDEEVSLG